MASNEDDDINRLFPKCRIRSPQMETAVLIDLTDDTGKKPASQTGPLRDVVDSDSEELETTPLHSLVYLGMQRRLSSKSRSTSAEFRRSKLRRPRAIDTWLQLYDAYGGGYEPSPDSEENDSDHSTQNKLPAKKSSVRQSSSESHIVGHWQKQESYRRQVRASTKEVYNVTPSRAEGVNTIAVGGESRLEIAGGREILSRSRTRPARKRHSAAQLNDNSTASSSSRSINRYSGEVYYEESVGRYGFHVDGSTLWGSQGLEPSFSIPSSLNEKPAAGHSVRRPLSWAGDDNLDASSAPGADDAAAAVANNHFDRTLIDDDIGEHDLGDGEYPPVSSLAALTGNGVLDSNESVSNAIHGYLTDFYPEIVAGGQNAVNGAASGGQASDASDAGGGGGAGHTLNIDNYLSEQLNQFAQSEKKMSKEGACQEEALVSLATVIGGLTIAQYEGSPRRYGLRSHSNGPEGGEMKSPCSTGGAATKAESTCSSSSCARPGFPRRVVSSSDDVSSNSYVSDQTFSPSLTRQTLAELTQICSSSASQSVKDSLLSTSLSPTQWDAKDVTGGSGGDGGVVTHADSGKDGDRDTTSTNAETDLGETEVGLVVGQSRNFTLSPETTDYDSELDAHSDSGGAGGGGGGASLTRTESENVSYDSTKMPIRIHSSNGVGRKFSSMPILEDGLSSGHCSEAENEACDRVPLMASRRICAALSPSSTVQYQQQVKSDSNCAGSVPLSRATTAVTPLTSVLQSQSKIRQLSNPPQSQQLWVKKVVNMDFDHENLRPQRKYLSCLSMAFSLLSCFVMCKYFSFFYGLHVLLSVLLLLL